MSAIALALLLSTAAAQAQFGAPEDAVKALYANYTGDKNGLPSDAVTARKFFVPDLAKQWLAAKNIEADFFVQGQDFELGPLKTAAAQPQGDKSTVVATLTNFKKPMRLTYEMRKSADGWRIADVSAGKDTLRAMLRKAK